MGIAVLEAIDMQTLRVLAHDIIRVHRGSVILILTLVDYLLLRVVGPGLTAVDLVALLEVEAAGALAAVLVVFHEQQALVAADELRTLGNVIYALNVGCAAFHVCGTQLDCYIVHRIGIDRVMRPQNLRNKLLVDLLPANYMLLLVVRLPDLVHRCSSRGGSGGDCAILPLLGYLLLLTLRDELHPAQMEALQVQLTRVDGRFQEHYEAFATKPVSAIGHADGVNALVNALDHAEADLAEKGLRRPLLLLT